MFSELSKPVGKLGCSRIVRVVLHLPLGVAGFVLAGAMVKPACGSLDFWTLQQLDKSQRVTGILGLGRPLRLWPGGWPFLPSSRCRVPSPDLLPSHHPGSASRASLGADTCSLRLPGPAALVPQCRTPSRAAHRRGLPAQAGLVQTAPRCPSSTPFQPLTPVSTLRPNCLRRTLTNRPLTILCKREKHGVPKLRNKLGPVGWGV